MFIYIFLIVIKKVTIKCLLADNSNLINLASRKENVMSLTLGAKLKSSILTNVETVCKRCIFMLIHSFNLCFYVNSARISDRITRNILDKIQRHILKISESLEGNSLNRTLLIDVPLRQD